MNAQPPCRTHRAPRRGARLWALLALGVAALHFPLLAVWAALAEQAGATAPWVVALFAIWAGLIALLAWVLKGAPD